VSLLSIFSAKGRLGPIKYF